MGALPTELTIFSTCPIFIGMKPIKLKNIVKENRDAKCKKFHEEARRCIANLIEKARKNGHLD